jgi:recombination associated protein RdgC
MNKKILPSAVVRKRVNLRAKDISESQGYDVSRKQLKDLKDSVTEELLAQAFSVETKVYGWIDPMNNWLVVNATSQARADDFLQELVKVIKDTQISFLRTTVSPSKAMKSWLMAKNLPSFFNIDSDCELAAPGYESKSVKYQGYSFSDSDVQKLLKEGMEVKRLALTWNNKISFVLHNNLQLKKITPSDELKETYSDSEDLFTAEFSVMATEFNFLFGSLLTVLDGEARLK